MDLTPFGYERRRDVCLILGAGATRGSSFIRPWTLQKPPLDVDFFKALRSSPIARSADAERLLWFVDREFGGLDVRMETFYSQAYLHDQFIGDFNQGRGRRRDYRWSLRYFLRVLPRLFGVSLVDRDCPFHELLVRWLSATDTVLSFNYDCVMDRALARVGGKRWDPARGYGFAVVGGTAEWCDHSGKGRAPSGTIRLLKPHGSFNWQRTPAGIELRPDPYASRDEQDLLIVPPLWQKSFDESPYHETWLAARKALSSAKALIVTGYSLPDTDVYTQAMLRMDVAELDFLCIVNPDPAARSRVIDAVKSAVSISTFIVELDSIEDVARRLAMAEGTHIEYPPVAP